MSHVLFLAVVQDHSTCKVCQAVLKPESPGFRIESFPRNLYKKFWIPKSRVYVASCDGWLWDSRPLPAVRLDFSLAWLKLVVCLGSTKGYQKGPGQDKVMRVSPSASWLFIILCPKPFE